MILSGINKSYQKDEVLKDLNLTVHDHEFLVILGSSGSGKSTLLKIIAGVESANSGSIIQNGQSIEKLPMQKRDVGYLFQEPLLFPHMTVRQNVSYSLAMAKKPKDEIQKKCDEYMQLLQIEELATRMPSELSGGQKQRVAIARAIINSPKMLLMDEPFSSLDYNLRIQMGKMLQGIKKQLGLTVVFVTHDIPESMLLADRIAFLHEGSLVEVNTPQQIYYSPTHEATAAFMGEYNKVNGQWVGEEFRTKYGSFKVPQPPHRQSEIFIRPNKVRIIKNQHGQHKIKNIVHCGKETRITLQDDPLIIDTYFTDDLHPGDAVDVHLEI